MKYMNRLENIGLEYIILLKEKSLTPKKVENDLNLSLKAKWHYIREKIVIINL